MFDKGWSTHVTAAMVLMWVPIPVASAGPGGQLTILCKDLPAGGLSPNVQKNGEVAEAVRLVDELVLSQELERAEELYKAVLEKRPRDECAVRGLARITEERAATTSKDSPLEAANKKWDAFYLDWYEPAAGLVLPFLAILLILFVCARLATRSVVRVDASEWQRVSVTKSWLAGVGMLVLAAAIPLLVAAWSRAVLALIVGFLLAIPGAFLVAASRGLMLRLQVSVRRADGQADANAVDYLIARLVGMGSAPPRGPEIPQDTDVTSLPVEALTSLPQGRVAVAAFTVLRAVRRGIPWRATVGLLDDDTATVTLLRNNALAEIEPIKLSELGLPAIPIEGKGKERDDAIALARTQLLTAAAAFILIELSKRHPRLRKGLCGAERWQSISLQILAAEDPLRKNQLLNKKLLGNALDLDSKNASAQVAYVHCFGRRADELKGQEHFAGLIEAEHERLLVTHSNNQTTPVQHQSRRPKPGFEALEMRALRSSAAVWLNILLLREKRHGAPKKQEAWRKARDSVLTLVQRLRDEPADEKLGMFVKEMRPDAAYLWYGVRDRATGLSADPSEEWTATKEANDAWTKDWGPEEGGLLSRDSRYDRACWKAERKYPNNGAAKKGLSMALEDLENAADLDELRVWARSDPSFRVFREEATYDQFRKKYVTIIGDPLKILLLDVPPFVDFAAKLRAYGILNEDHLDNALPRRLALALEVDPRTVARWLDIVELGRITSDPPSKIDIPTLGLLLAAGVESVEELRKELRTPSKLYKKLIDASVGLAIAPSRAQTVNRWKRVL